MDAKNIKMNNYTKEYQYGIYKNLNDCCDGHYNRIMAKKLGCDVAVLYGNLLYLDCIFYDRKDDEGYFIGYAKKIEENTGLSRHRINKAREILKEKGYIDYKQEDDFCYKYKILILVSKDGREFKYNNSGIDYEELEVRLIVKDVIEYLNLKTGKNFDKNDNVTINYFRHWINKGFNSEDFIMVIDKKYKEWIDTEFEKYLRPETLFGEKFTHYLNEPEKVRYKDQYRQQDKSMEEMQRQYEKERELIGDEDIGII